MYNLGVSKEDVIIATGHKDTKMIDQVYLHQTDADKAKRITRSVKGLKGSMFNMGISNSKQEPYPTLQVSKNNAVVETVNISQQKNVLGEGKEVCAVLGVPAHIIADIKDKYDLARALYPREKQIIDMGLELKIIKKIFNLEGKTVSERYATLHKLINEIQSRLK